MKPAPPHTSSLIEATAEVMNSARPSCQWGSAGASAARSVPSTL